MAAHRSGEETPAWLAWALLSTTAAAFLAWLLLWRRPDIRPAGKLVFAGVVQVFGAGLTVVLLTMGQKYLSPAAGVVWGALAAGQGLLILLVLGDGFELAEAVWGRVWRRRPRLVPAPLGAALPKVSHPHPRLQRAAAHGAADARCPRAPRLPRLRGAGHRQ